MPEKSKTPEFVVTDRRKFTSEGELRDESAPPQETTAPPAASASVEGPASTTPAPETPPAARDIPPPPSAEEQSASHDAYQGRRVGVQGAGRSRADDFQMTFERLVASLYMTAMVQLGLIREEGAEPLADLVGAQQTIDTIGLLAEKTRGNLTDAETSLLQSSLYELRMAFVEITNALARPPQGPGGGVK
ncbi:MAG: DUF1844 domain-containing protein [Acidobacteria bacterium]|nr:DUF1844 domain-containing protein [Acidobacteriota bacterium]